jgi:hypothetical protein
MAGEKRKEEFNMRKIALFLNHDILYIFISNTSSEKDVSTHNSATQITIPK